MAAEKRGSIAFFSSYRPPVPLDIFSCPRLPPPASKRDELPMTDGVSYNYNGRVIPPEGLKTILMRPKLASQLALFKEDQDGITSGRLSGMVFVSERGNLETLHVALCFVNDNVEVFSLADVFGTSDDVVRMEDSGCVAGDYLVYVTTKDPAVDRRQPWTAVYKTNLKTGATHRLTPKLQADLSPSVSPSGKKIAVASFQRKAGWNGEIEDLNTCIVVMNVERPLERRLVVRKGGWPTWGSDSVIFFHRKDDEGFWGVFRADISTGETSRVTPKGIDAVTPAAIDATTVAVATMRKKTDITKGAPRAEAQYRHIEVFDSTGRKRPMQITRNIMPEADHFNPFVIDGGKRIGYHRCKTDHLCKRSGDTDIERKFHRLDSPHPDVGLFRVSGVFPTFSGDGSKVAFVDNEFKAVWLADSQGLRKVYETKDRDSIFSPVWNQDPKKDILYVCMGPSFNARETVYICAIPNVSSCAMHRQQLTRGRFNDAFPSTNPDGTKLVFRSTRGGGGKRHKNLYIMEDTVSGEYGEGKITRLTNGEWTDTHCQWSPAGDWIVFSSTRDKPEHAPESDNGLDPGLNECRGSQEVKKEHICGRPLGLQFNKMTRDLYIADAYFGLMIVSEGDKFAKQIVTQAQNTPLKFTNGLDIDQDTGIVYFTDSSARFQRRENILIEISGDKTGRVLSYNPQNKAVRVLLNGLSYPNGVALSKDGSFLLIAETSTCRILRYWLQPNKDKRAQVLTQLPGYPDNVKSSPRGGFWVAHYERKSKFMEWVMSLPTWVREYIILLPLDVITKIFYKFSEWHGEPLAMRVSGEGEVLELLEDFGGEIVKYISEVEEHNATLWIGSVVMPHVGIYKL